MEENEVLKPRNSLELMRWLIFEPELLVAYSQTIKGQRASLRAMLMLTPWITLGSFMLYLLGILSVAGFDLPRRFPNLFRSEVAANWSNELWKNAFLCFDLSIGVGWIGLVIGLAIGLLIGVIANVSIRFDLGLFVGLVSVLILGIAFCLTASFERVFEQDNPLIGVGIGFLFGITLGLTMGLIGGLVLGLWGGLIGGLVYGLNIGLAEGFTRGLSEGLGVWVIFLFFYCRSYFFIYYILQGFFQKFTFEKNPHQRDGVIFFPLWGMEENFQKQAYEYPEKGMVYSRFLFKRRIFQKQLAWQVQLASTAGQWRKNRLHPATFKAFPEMDEAAVWIEDNYLFIKPNRLAVPLPSLDWQPQIETTRLRLLEFEQESNVQIRVSYFRKFITELDKLYDLALRQPHSWGQYFVKALELWQKSATEKLRDLELEAQAEEPIVANIYRGGEKLRPDDRALFLGRADLRDAFKKRVVTAVQMPLFFIQGQRRVGKSSVIAFLPTILDRGFSVVAYDMQEQPGLALPVLLDKILERVRSTLGIENKPPLPFAPVVDSAIQDLVTESAPEQRSGIPPWLDAWQHFRAELEAIADQHPAKIVLAIDEYEDFHRILQSYPAQGDALLAAMRAYSQSQNRVVFLFAGADYFSELKNPDWGAYFVQAERLLVDYLDHDDSLKLIQLVDLKYPPELLERMYHETQGHPCLLQKICREVVTIVNKTGRVSRAVTEADYDAAIKKEILKPDDGVMSIFWGQFCENRGLKPTVRQILAAETPSDEWDLLVLEDHGFIIREGGQIRLRVPLFEQWLRRYQVM